MASYTKRDATDAMRYASARETLHLLNRVLVLFPQVFSHTVVELLPASPLVDYRFDRSFADHALLLRARWHGKRGCENASCYPTYPKGKMCDQTTPPVVFATGEAETVQACQPACFMRQRALAVLRRTTAKSRSLFTDDERPRECLECSALNPLVTEYVVRRRIDAEYDVWRDGKPVDELPTGFHLRDALTRDNVPYPVADVGFTAWNEEESRCEQLPDQLFRHVVEPYWRDPSHSICRSTNFRVGEQTVAPYYSRQMQDPPRSNPNLVGFLQRNTRTYCRAFDKLYDPDTGECKAPWWEDALTYTLLGEGIIRLVRNAVQGEVGCLDDAWVPTGDEVSGDAEPGLARTLREWRSDVDVDFVLPPPNVTLLDLGIDVLLTGNRLYWNNREGVISHMAMFVTVEAAAWTDLYANYNDESGKGDEWSRPWGPAESSVSRRPEIADRVREKCIGVMTTVAESLPNPPRGKFQPEDVRHFVDTIDETLSESQLLAVLKELGLTVAGDATMRALAKLLKTTLKRTMQFLVRNMGGHVAGALMRSGVRMAMARIVGNAVSQLTLRLIAIGSTAATGIGIVVSAIELLSFVIDMALLFGWDPGNYRAYTSTATFKQLMDATFRAKILDNAYDLTPIALATQLMRATNDDTDKSSTAADNAGGTADAKLPDSGSLAASLFELTDNADLQVTKPRWFNKRWAQCFLNDAESTRRAPTRDLLIPRIQLDNDPAMWSTVQDLFFLGSLSTNSLGQLVNLDEQRDEVRDEDLVDAMEQADYREIGTVSVKRDVDSTTFNARARFGGTWSAILATVAVLAIGTATMLRTNRRLAFLLVCLALLSLSLLVIVASAVAYYPVDPAYAAQVDPTRTDDTNRAKLSDVVDPATLSTTLSQVVATLQSTAAELQSMAL